MSGETKTGPGTSLPALHCMCANLRRAARAVTRLYNHELQTAGIEITQLTLLMALERTGEISQGELGRLLALDSTSLTRMLRLLEKPEWITAKIGEDRRERLWRLTASGREKLKQSRPHWRRAQEKLRNALGEETAGLLARTLAEVVRVSTEA